MTRTPTDEEDEAVADPVEIELMLRETLQRWSVEPTGDQRVFEDVAARLLCYAPLYLRNLRMERKGPRALKVAGRVSYRIPDIARWIADETEVF